MNVGVLALQGASRPHLDLLESLGVAACEVRRREQLADATHLIVPGGESTTIRRLLDLFDLTDLLVARARAGDLAVFGTCAGAILLGADDGTSPPRLGLLDASFERNAYGTQVDSFAAPLALTDDPAPFRGIFIRAPRIERVGAGVEVLARHGTQPVCVRQGLLVAATFHPELSGDARIHQAFLARAPAPKASPR